MKMDIVSRNLFRLLRAGAFGQTEDVEPMSAWKWHVLYERAMMHRVGALVRDGMEACRRQFYMQMPAEQWAQWDGVAHDTEQAYLKASLRLTELVGTFTHEQWRPIVMGGQSLARFYPRPDHRFTNRLDLYFPFETQAKRADRWAYANGTCLDDSVKGTLTYLWQDVRVAHHRSVERLTNPLLHRHLTRMVERELREQPPQLFSVNGQKMETLTPTLAILQCLLHIARDILNDGLSVSQLVDLGIYLRGNGQNVDFVKLQDWIALLSVQRLAQVTARLMMLLLDFTLDELPFVNDDPVVDTSRLEAELFTRPGDSDTEWFFTQGKGIFVHSSNNGAMLWRLNHSARYFKYYPKESVTNLMAAFAHSLSHVEE